MHWRKEEQAKDNSSGRGKYEWHGEVPSTGLRQIQETPCMQEQEDSHQAQSKPEGVDNGEAFRRGVVCVGRTTRPAGTQSAALS